MKTKKKGLAEAVAGRVEFLKKVIEFALSIVRERGVQLEHTVHSFHTNTVSELRDFGDFSFHTDTGHSEMGGNRLRVWYHPNHLTGRLLVLNVYWQCGIAECSPDSFNSDPAWQEEILKVIRCRKSIAKKIDRAIKTAAGKSAARAEETRRNFALAETAKRLQVI